MANTNPISTGKKIKKIAIRALTWAAFPGLAAPTTYYNIQSNKRPSQRKYYYIPLEFPIFIGATALTVTSLVGMTNLYENKVNKQYNNKSHNISIQTKHNYTAPGFWNGISYASPIIRALTFETGENSTIIKTDSLEIKLYDADIITFDTNKGFILDKEKYYASKFKVKYGSSWLEYNQDETKKIAKEYEQIKKENVQIRKKILESGNIGLLTEAESKLSKLQNDYESTRGQIKQTQIKFEKEITQMLDQLNNEYFTYKNAPADTAIPGRDYELSNVKNK